MSKSDFAGAAQDCSRNLYDVAAATTEFYLSLLTCARGRVTPRRAGGTERRQRFRAEIWNMRRLLRIAMSGGMDREVVGVIGALARQRRRVQAAVIVWIDAIEVLVQTKEKRYGGRAGLGPIKAAEVKEAVRYLLRRREFDLPRIPDYLEPLVMQVLIDEAVDALVRVLNRYGMWEEAAEPARPLRARWARLWLALGRFFRPLLAAVARLAQRVWEAAHRRVPLSPQLREALDALEREGLIVRCQDVVSWASTAVVWVVRHRAELAALFELVFAAVQEAESYLELSGPEKKEYATDLVLAVLDELGFKARAGLMFAVVASTVSTSIEAAVHLFNKRGVFAH